MERLDRIPPRPLPILYFGVSHLCLVGAFLAAALDPARVAGFFLQPYTLAIVHLVTLGWLTCSILGALYIVGPMALRTSMPARLPDYVAWACVTVGLLGIVGHFFVDEYGGIAWSGGKAHPFLRGTPLQRVFAHAHLAAIGWAGMMAIGVG